VTPLWTFQVTAVLLIPVTAAKNCLVDNVPVEGGTIANRGDMAIVIGPLGPEIVTIAFPLFEGSALLVAVSTTGFVRGMDAGARKSTFPEAGPAGGTHGFVTTWQT